MALSLPQLLSYCLALTSSTSAIALAFAQENFTGSLPLLPPPLPPTPQNHLRHPHLGYCRLCSTTISWFYSL